MISSIPAGIKAKQNHFQSVQCNPRNATHVHTHTDIQRGTDPSKTFQAVQYPWVDTTLLRGVLSAACKLHPSSLRGTHTECTHPHEWVWGSALCPGHGDGQGAESRRETQTFIHILSCFLQEKQTWVLKRNSLSGSGLGCIKNQEVGPKVVMQTNSTCHVPIFCVGHRPQRAPQSSQQGLMPPATSPGAGLASLHQSEGKHPCKEQTRSAFSLIAARCFRPAAKSTFPSPSRASTPSQLMQI